MSKFKEKSRRAAEFFSGKGFYIILILCVAAIGVSGYVLFFTGDGVGPAAETAGTELAVIPDDPAQDYINSAAGGMSGARDEYAYIPRDAHGPYDLPSLAELPLTPKPPEDPAPSEPPEAPDKNTSQAAENPDNGEKPAKDSELPAEKASALKGAYIWPVTGKVSQPFSKDELVFNSTLDDWRVHAGIDIEAPAGTKVVAIGAGAVEDIYESELMGTTVVIDHGNELKSVYSNLMASPTVKKDGEVRAGDTIGGVGNTAIGESAQTAHVHLEIIQDGAQIDPETFLPR